MYNKTKQIIKALVSKSFLFKYEPIFRSVLYQFYRGKVFQCKICNKRLRKFIQLENDDKLCPNCGSLARNRRLWDILSSKFLNEKLNILDFSPSRCLYRILKNNPSITYSSTDLSGDFLSDHKFDITNIDSQNETYDLIICYHILEHVENDNQAIKELYRILKPKGVCIVQTPFKQGDIYEDFSIRSDEGRIKYFGQSDHVRIYSVQGLKERLTDHGFQVEIKEYSEDANNIYGYPKEEFVLFCKK
jgi:SAM-dependent methyltransferase